MLRATGEVVKVDVREGTSGADNRAWRMAVVRIVVNRSEFVDVTIAEDSGRFVVTLPADGEKVDYAVEASVRPARGSYGPQLSLRVTGDFMGAFAA